MKKTFKIEIDCANCANLVEEAARKVAGVKDLTVSFMTQKMKVVFDDDADQDAVRTRLSRRPPKLSRISVLNDNLI